MDSAIGVSIGAASKEFYAAQGIALSPSVQPGIQDSRAYDALPQSGEPRAKLETGGE